MGDVTTALTFLNVLIVPALTYLVRIDKRLGQIDVIQQDHGRRLATLEDRIRTLEMRKEMS